MAPDIGISVLDPVDPVTARATVDHSRRMDMIGFTALNIKRVISMIAVIAKKNIMGQHSAIMVPMVPHRKDRIVTMVTMALHHKGHIVTTTTVAMGVINVVGV